MARSVKKGPLSTSIWRRRLRAMNESRQKQVVRTWSRRSTITPEMVGLHNRRAQRAKIYSRSLLAENMVGHKLGEFSPTRTFFAHSGDRKAEAKETVARPLRRRPAAAAPRPAAPAAPAAKG